MARKDALLRLRERLIAKRNVLRKKLAEELNLSYDEQSSGRDLGDAANDGACNERNSQLAALESRELTQIERAIEMIREGHYGRCEVCDKSIPITRLNALPFTPTCVNCQRLQEENVDDPFDTDASWERVFEQEGRLSGREYSMRDLDSGS